MKFSLPHAKKFREYLLDKFGEEITSDKPKRDFIIFDTCIFGGFKMHGYSSLIRISDNIIGKYYWVKYCDGIKERFRHFRGIIPGHNNKEISLWFDCRPYNGLYGSPPLGSNSIDIPFP